ncbi:hypothetical protein ABIE56_000924 [Luteibacter sp. 621]|jgi:hypothetical protein|uniref:hypothetical protein n=1 Tax=Luteibacter sp. 621 TaxID=3373916 RepID=UPI003D1F2C66
MADLRDTFSPVAERYRRIERIAAGGTVLFFLSIALASTLGHMPTFFAMTAIAGWLTVVSALFVAPRLICPGCQKPVDRPEGEWCPCCGERSLSKQTLWRKRTCFSCHRRFSNRRKSRIRGIRYCTHCSSYLDEKGI